MNLTVNNTSFCGKNEVLYNLNKAARAAKNAETCKALCAGPRPLNRVTEAKVNEAVMSAYIDSAVNDSTFFSSLKDIVLNRETGEMKDLLSPKKLQYSSTNPFNIFKDKLVSTMCQHDKNSQQETLHKFLLSIKTIPEI